MKHRRTRRRGGTCGSCMMQSGAGLTSSRPNRRRTNRRRAKNKKNAEALRTDPRHDAMIALEVAALSGQADQVSTIMDVHSQLENGDYGIVLDPSTLTADVLEILNAYHFFTEH